MVMLSLEMIAEIRAIANLYATTERARLARAEESSRRGYAEVRDAMRTALEGRYEGMTLDRLLDLLPTPRALSEVRVARLALEGAVTTSITIDGLHDPKACTVRWVGANTRS